MGSSLLCDTWVHARRVKSKSCRYFARHFGNLCTDVCETLGRHLPVALGAVPCADRHRNPCGMLAACLCVAPSHSPNAFPKRVPQTPACRGLPISLRRLQRLSMCMRAGEHFSSRRATLYLPPSQRSQPNSHSAIGSHPLTAPNEMWFVWAPPVRATLQGPFPGARLHSVEPHTTS